MKEPADWIKKKRPLLFGEPPPFESVRNSKTLFALPSLKRGVPFGSLRASANETLSVSEGRVFTDDLTIVVPLGPSGRAARVSERSKSGVFTQARSPAGCPARTL
jgi:hypothetical protein